MSRRNYYRKRPAKLRKGRLPCDLAIHDINNKPAHSRVLRYRKTSGFHTVVITREDVLKALISVITSSTAYTSIIDAIKINSVRMILLPDADGDAADFSFSWTGDRGPDQMHTLVVTNAVPAGMNLSVPEDSLAGFWSLQTSDTTETLFTMQTNTGYSVILDLHCSIVYGDGTTATGVLTGVSAFTGITAIELPVGGTALVPVGITSDQTTS